MGQARQHCAIADEKYIIINYNKSAYLVAHHSDYLPGAKHRLIDDVMRPQTMRINLSISLMYRGLDNGLVSASAGFDSPLR